MPAEELSGISGLDGRRRAVLAQKLKITNWYELIMADRQRIAEAFGRRTIRPALEEVAAWQDEARRMRAASIEASVSEAAASGWEPGATFVVAFEERRRQGTLERRVVAEQTEVEPEASPQQRSEWPGWTGDDVLRWMLDRVSAPVSPAPPSLPEILSPAESGAAETVAGSLPEILSPAESGAAETVAGSLPEIPSPAKSGAAETATGETPAAVARIRPKIDIERANLADSHGSTELVAGSRPVAAGRLLWAQPTRLVVMLGGVPVGPGVSVVLQFVQADGRKQIIKGRLSETGRVAQVELSGLTEGEYRATIVASAPDGSFLPRMVKLPPVEVIGLAPGSGSPP